MASVWLRQQSRDLFGQRNPMPRAPGLLVLLSCLGDGGRAVEVRSSDVPGLRGSLSDEELEAAAIAVRRAKPLHKRWRTRLEGCRREAAARQAAEWFAARGYVAAGARVATSAVDVRVRSFSGVVATAESHVTKPRTIARRLGLVAGRPFVWRPERWRAVSAEFYASGAPVAAVDASGQVGLDVSALAERDFRNLEVEVGLDGLELYVQDRNIGGLGLRFVATASDRRLGASIGEQDKWSVGREGIVIGVDEKNHGRRLGRHATLTVARSLEFRLTRHAARAWDSARFTDARFLGLVSSRAVGRCRVVGYVASARPARPVLPRAPAAPCGATLEVAVNPHCFAFLDASRGVGDRTRLQAGLVLRASIFETDLTFRREGRPVLAFRFRDPAAGPPPPSAS